MKEYIEKAKIVGKIEVEYNLIRKKYDNEPFESPFKRFDLGSVTTLHKTISMIEQELAEDVVEMVMERLEALYDTSN